MPISQGRMLLQRAYLLLQNVILFDHAIAFGRSESIHGAGIPSGLYSWWVTPRAAAITYDASKTPATWLMKTRGKDGSPA